MQKTHFTYAADCWMLTDDYVVVSAYGSRNMVLILFLIGRSLHAEVNLVLADDSGRLVVADIGFKSFEFRRGAFCAPNIVAERISFNRLLAPFLDDLKQIVLAGDWNAILDHKIDRVRRGASGSERYEGSLTFFFMAHHDFIDGFRLDDLGKEIWTWLDSSPSVRVRSYMDRELEEPTLILLGSPFSISIPSSPQTDTCSS